MFFINDLDDWIGNFVTELADGTNLGERQAKTLEKSLEKKEDSVERRCIFFDGHKQIHRNREQLGSNLQKQFRRIQAEWDSAVYWCFGKRHLRSEVFGQELSLCKKWCSSLPYIRAYRQGPASLTLPCWLWLASFISDLPCHCRMSGHHQATADPGYQHSTRSALLIWVLWDCIACQWGRALPAFHHTPYVNNKSWLKSLN